MHCGVPEKKRKCGRENIWKKKDKKKMHKSDEIHEYKHPRCSVKFMLDEHKGIQIETYLY